MSNPHTRTLNRIHSSPSHKEQRLSKENKDSNKKPNQMGAAEKRLRRRGYKGCEEWGAEKGCTERNAEKGCRDGGAEGK